MTKQLSIFDAPALRQPTDAEKKLAAARAEGARRKAAGIERATWGKERLLGHAREIGHDVAKGVLPHADGVKRADGLCTADDIQWNWQREKPPLPPLGNLAGAIFRCGNWRDTGKRIKSSRPEAHVNELRIWEWIHN